MIFAFMYQPASMATVLPDRSSKRWLAVIIGGLLSSNCCALQLLLNFMGVGCAGFAILSPFRLFFFFAASLSFFLLGTSHSTSRAIDRSTQAAIFCALVSMPEMISFYSRYASYYSSTSENNLPSSALFVRIFGMKCAACGERSRTLSLSVPCVRDSAVHWERGYMKMHIVAGSDIAKCGHDVSAVLKRAGFEIVSLELCADSSVKSAVFPHENSSGNCSLFV
jgi:hypothetical protein